MARQFMNEDFWIKERIEALRGILKLFENICWRCN